MQRARRARRLTSLAAVVAVGVLALTGCRSDPAVAAYVGSTRYTDDRVNAIADEAHAKLQQLADTQGAASGASTQPVDAPVTAQQVVSVLVSRDVLKTMAQAKKLKPLNVATDQIAQQLQLPADTQYVQLIAEKDSYRLALLQAAKSVEPTETELHEVYDNLVKASGGSYASTPYSQFKSTLSDQDSELVGRSAAVRNEIADEASKLDVTVNPRYGPAVLSLVDITDQQGGVHSLLGLSLDSQDPGVVDLG